MATQNNINKKTQSLTIDPGASGDSWTQYSINGTPEFRIGVDDTDDSFRISQGNALGTTDTFLMTSAGERTMPFQPCFLSSVRSTMYYNITGDGSIFTIPHTSSKFDQGSDFDGASTFTAPKTAKYFFSFSLYLDDVLNTLTSFVAYFSTTGGDYKVLNLKPVDVAISWYYAKNCSCIISMTAGDTCAVKIVGSGGASNFVDVRGSVGSFDGYLIC